jgi:hypothetical protein
MPFLHMLPDVAMNYTFNRPLRGVSRRGSCFHVPGMNVRRKSPLKASSNECG